MDSDSDFLITDVIEEKQLFLELLCFFSFCNPIVTGWGKLSGSVVHKLSKHETYTSKLRKIIFKERNYQMTSDTNLHSMDDIM
jgi:hypothetical protein